MNEEARRLKSQGVDIIIVLSHCGLDVDRIMAAKCPLIDLVVGGHSHTFLYTGTFIDHSLLFLEEERLRTKRCKAITFFQDHPPS